MEIPAPSAARGLCVGWRTLTAAWAWPGPPLLWLTFDPDPISLLMCVNFFIGLLPLSPEGGLFRPGLHPPRESLSLILDYLDYVSAIPQSQSTPLLLACLFTIGLSASAGLRTLLQTMDELYQGPPGQQPAPPGPQCGPLPAVS